MDTFTWLEALCTAAGAGGLEEAAETARRLLAPYMDETAVDALGNVGGLRRCGKDGAPLLLLEAHIDEIGFIVTSLDEKGFLHVSPCGGVDARALPAAEVMFYGEGEPLPGVFASTPPHLADTDGDGFPAIRDMGIDTGLEVKKLKKRCPPGTRATFRPHFRRIGETRVSSKALDDRAGVAAVLACLDILKDQALTVDLAVTFAVQEELGCRGSAVAAYAADPDMAIAVDVSFAHTPDADRSKCGVLAGGPMVGYAPSLDTALSRRLYALAMERDIPCQREVMPGDTGTDADAIASARGGVRTGLLSIPLRYMHTPAELVDIRDIEDTGRLMAAFIAEGGACQ